MESRATKKHIRMSARKMRLVIDTIRGKSAAEAFNILKYSTKRAAKPIENTLRSAIANMENMEDGIAVDYEEIYIKEIFSNGGPTMKRIQPAPMGRAYRIRKRTNHLTVVVAEYQEDIEEEDIAEELEIEGEE